jgi:hypothetical protein
MLMAPNRTGKSYQERCGHILRGVSIEDLRGGG